MKRGKFQNQFHSKKIDGVHGTEKLQTVWKRKTSKCRKGGVEKAQPIKLSKLSLLVISYFIFSFIIFLFWILGSTLFQYSFICIVLFELLGSLRFPLFLFGFLLFLFDFFLIWTSSFLNWISSLLVWISPFLVWISPFLVWISCSTLCRYSRLICIVDRRHQFGQQLHWQHLHTTDHFIFALGKVKRKSESKEMNLKKGT